MLSRRDVKLTQTIRSYNDSVSTNFSLLPYLSSTSSFQWEIRFSSSALQNFDDVLVTVILVPNV